VNCHGVQGEGDGPGAALLLPPPRRLSDPHWQGRVTDDHIAQVIVEGGLSAGLSPNMAANPDLRGHPELVRALVQMIREL
jgi:hypothetical protein